MRIGVDATCWQNRRGYGRYVRALLSTLVRLDAESRYTFFTDSTEHSETLPPKAEVRLVRTSLPATVAASADGHRSIRDMWRMSQAMSDSRLDLLLFPTVYSYVPVVSRAKKLVMIHDVIPETYPLLTLPTRTSRFLWKAKVLLGRWQADAVVTVSDYSRVGIIRHFNIPPEQIFVVEEASDPVFRVIDDPKPTLRLRSFEINGEKRVVTYVGGFSPHKNLQNLVRAFAKLLSREELSDVLLVMAGDYQNEVFYHSFGAVRQQVQSLDIAHRVIFAGHLGDEDLVVLLNLSTVLVLPSLMEGFGLPALEAAACGCPVIATSASPLPGLLGDAAIYINPTEPAELETALVRVLGSESLRQKMRQSGLAAAGRLTWEASAREMIKIMRHVMFNGLPL